MPPIIAVGRDVTGIMYMVKQGMFTPNPLYQIKPVTTSVPSLLVAIKCSVHIIYHCISGSQTNYSPPQSGDKPMKYQACQGSSTSDTMTPSMNCACTLIRTMLVLAVAVVQLHQVLRP